jgi:hypothetical protein
LARGLPRFSARTFQETTGNISGVSGLTEADPPARFLLTQIRKSLPPPRAMPASLVTHDQATMPRHFREFLRSERSPGLIVVPQHLPIGEVADDLILIWTATDAEEWTDRIAFLPI